MAFKDNLLNKIEIDHLAQTVIDSWGPPGSGARMDAEAMRRLLEYAPYDRRRERDLELYVKDTDGKIPVILVLDNELKIYRTAVEDVVMRKSPLIKEMVSIRNAIKILKDSDVVISRKEASVKTVQQESIALLDLSYTADDLSQIAAEGAAALANGYAEGVEENLILLAELLNFQPAPAPFQIRHFHSWGVVEKNAAGAVLFGPMVVYSLAHNRLIFIEDQLNSRNEEQMKHWHELIVGKQKAAVENETVFSALEQLVLRISPSPSSSGQPDSL